MTPTLAHAIQWTTAAPLWPDAARTPATMRRPALLRFASDAFMEDLAGVLARDPRTLSDFVAVPESFRERPPGAPANWNPAPPLLKLFQPAHGHFYLVAANLVCRQPGLPDRVVDAGAKEAVSFVLRRIGEGGGEMAWIENADGKNWAPIAEGKAQAVVANEQQLPMFPMNYTERGRKRRLFVGLVPTSSSETFKAAPTVSPIDTTADPRTAELSARVIEPLSSLVRQTVPGSATAAERNLIAAKQVEVSLFILLDLAQFLATNVPKLWAAIEGTGTLNANSPEASVLTKLVGRTVDGATSWRTALREAWKQWDKINGENGDVPTLTYNLRGTTYAAGNLDQDLRALLAAVKPGPPPTETLPGVPKIDPAGTVRYVLRCVYRRPVCGPLQPDLVSDPTETFTIAPFFDFDAPARPVRISMPLDPSIAGLRKFRKNVSFLLSDKLREQMSRATDLKKAIEGNFASTQTFDLGEICSFSIPIITICALIVLIIFIILLNIVFWWLPLFRLCFPIKLKAKG